MYVVITRDQCNFCDAAKALLSEANLSWVSINLQDKGSRWLLTLFKQAGFSTVPQIYAPDGTHIGGYKELEQRLT